MKRRMTPKEIAKVAYFTLSLVALVVLCESVPACVLAVINLAIAARVLRTVPIDEIVDD